MEGVQVMVPVDILNEVMPVYLKEGFSTRQAIFAVATVLVASRADLFFFCRNKDFVSNMVMLSSV